MVASVCFDVVFMFADVTVISLLSYTGLPLNCAGLTAPLCKATCPIKKKESGHPVLTVRSRVNNKQEKRAISGILDGRLQ